MTMHRHGISIGIERFGDQFFLVICAVGTLTHQDYERITPILEAALAKVEGPKVRLLFDATAFDGWEMRAAWDDFRLGLRHGSDFEKVAIYGNTAWQDLASRIGSWFIAGEIKAFTDLDSAVAWLRE